MSPTTQILIFNTNLVMNWQQQFKKIKKIFFKKTGKNASRVAIADFLGVSRGKVQAWDTGQRPNSDDLETLSRKLEINPCWLLLGEGDPDSWKTDSSIETTDSILVGEVKTSPKLGDELSYNDLPEDLRLFLLNEGRKYGIIVDAGPVTESVATVESALEGAGELAIINAVLAKLTPWRNDLAHAHRGYGSVDKFKEASLHEPPAGYNDEAACDLAKTSISTENNKESSHKK